LFSLVASIWTTWCLPSFGQTGSESKHQPDSARISEAATQMLQTAIWSLQPNKSERTDSQYQI
jgi:hypothetical protein